MRPFVQAPKRLASAGGPGDGVGRCSPSCARSCRRSIDGGHRRSREHLRGRAPAAAPGAACTGCCTRGSIVHVPLSFALMVLRRRAHRDGAAVLTSGCEFATAKKLAERIDLNYFSTSHGHAAVADPAVAGAAARGAALGVGVRRRRQPHHVQRRPGVERARLRGDEVRGVPQRAGRSRRAAGRAQVPSPVPRAHQRRRLPRRATTRRRTPSNQTPPPRVRDLPPGTPRPRAAREDGRCASASSATAT